MVKILFAVVALVAISAGAVFVGWQDDPPTQQDASEFMKRKLDSSREILAGLATEDFEQVGKHAQDLMLLSHEAEWNVIQTPPYVRFSSEFRASAQRLRDAGAEQNLDGATLAYFEITLNCVRCHKYIRKNRAAGNR